MMKAKLKKYLKSCRAHWITDIKEEIISLHWKVLEDYPALPEYAVQNGWVTAKENGNFFEYYFTQKGMDEIMPLISDTCITGRTSR